MTVSTELSHEEYVGNDVTTDFDFRFRIFESRHLIVVVADEDGNETTLKNGTDYTIVGAGSYHGGKVVLNKPLARGWTILLERDLPVVQETDLRNQGKFFAEVHEDAFDYLTMLIQKALGTFSLSLRKPTYLSNYYDAKGNRIANLASPKLGADAANKDYVDNSIKDIDSKTLRVKDKPINALPNTEQRANKILAFDSVGQPITVLPESGSASDVLIDLGKPTGAGKIGTESGDNLQNVIIGKQFKFSLSAIELGAISDRKTDNTQLIQQIIDDNIDSHIFLTIEPGVYWHFKKIQMRNGINIIDMSGYDDEYDHWNEHIKYFFNHNVNNNLHNGNTFHLLGRHHPAFIVDNIGQPTDPEGEEYRASIVFRYRSRLMSRVGVGVYGNDKDFVITDREGSGRFVFRQTNKNDFEMSFGGQAIPGVAYTFHSREEMISENFIFRYIAKSNGKIHNQFYIGNKEVFTSTINEDGSIRYALRGSVIGGVSSTGGQLSKCNLISSSEQLEVYQTNSILHNAGVDIDTQYTLPIATSGCSYIVHRVNSGKITLKCRAGDSFNDSTNSKELPMGASTIVCYMTNKWYVVS